MQQFIYEFQKYYGKLYFVQIDGCMHGVKSPDGWPVQKSWIVMTNDWEFQKQCQLTCDHRHEHRPGGMVGMGSKAVSDTAFYPESMVQAIAKLWKSQWFKARKVNDQQIFQALNTLEKGYPAEESEAPADETVEEDEPVPKEVELERQKAWSLLHRLHRAAGHPHNRALARLCQDRKMPQWLIQMALKLKCQACVDTKKGEQLTLPVSLGARSKPWQILGMDVYELAFPRQGKKSRYLVMLCLTMRLTSVFHLWQGELHEAGTDPGDRLVEAFIESWLLHRPKPEWVLVDSQSSLCKGVFTQFLSSIGVGMSVTAGQAPWQHGSTESMVKALKSTIKRIRNEQPTISPKVCGQLAAMAQNNVDAVKGFSPNQWAYGSDPNQWHGEINPLMANEDRMNHPVEFWQLQRNREKAEEIHRQELAKQRMSRLSNAASRPTRAYAVGDWVCVWRRASVKSRRREFNPEARFIGPGRVAMMEPAALDGGQPAVFWVLMGTALWRCAPEQLRPATEEEIITEAVKLGHKATLPMSELLQRWHSSVDVTKEPRFDPEQDLLPEVPPDDGVSPSTTPLTAQPPQEWQKDVSRGSDSHAPRRHSRSRSAERGRVKQEISKWNRLTTLNEVRRQDGLPPLALLPEDDGKYPPDTWEVKVKENKLIRHHSTPRISLFDPRNEADTPFRIADLVKRRTTFWDDGEQSGSYNDDWQDGSVKEKSFVKPWTGRTEFIVFRGAKRKVDEHYIGTDDEAGTATGTKRSANMIDTNAGLANVFHLDTEDTPQNDMVEQPKELLVNDLIPEEKDADVSETSAAKMSAWIEEEQSKETLLLNYMRSSDALDEECCFIDLQIDDMSAFVMDHTAYINQKLQSPSKEVNFRKLTEADQKLMMEAMAREISEVLRSQSLRALREYVPEDVLRERCLPMRWILTWKPLDAPEKPPTDGTPTVLRPDGLSKAEARVVLIGYKHPDLARRDERTGRRQLQTSAPTLSRIGRQQFLQAVALDEHELESADAKSAFLQADEGIGTDAIFTYGVPELQYAYGISRWEALQVLGAFYGLTSAPRIFWKDADSKLVRNGARRHALDKCIWLVMDASNPELVVGRVASHVDDFLIAGDKNNDTWKAFRAALKNMYKWSPWQSGSFVFAGIELRQTKDYNIYMTQETFCNNLRPIMIQNEHSRPSADPLTPAELTQCRGLTMKAQWRAIQTAPQYCARIGLLASSLSQPTVKELKEANSLMKELRKTSKEDLIFHSFNFHRTKKLKWYELIGLHFGDASGNNRPCGGATGGYITGFADPEILNGKEAPVTIID